jgi:hypothetical protein
MAGKQRGYTRSDIAVGHGAPIRRTSPDKDAAALRSTPGSVLDVADRSKSWRLCSSTVRTGSVPAMTASMFWRWTPQYPAFEGVRGRLIGSQRSVQRIFSTEPIDSIGLNY